MCTITGDLRNVEDALERNIGLLGAEFWSLDVNVCIRFGGTELEANLEWKENVSDSVVAQMIAPHSRRLIIRESYALVPQKLSQAIRLNFKIPTLI